MKKNKLSSRIAGIGLVALAFALTLNFVYASKNYGIAYNALSVYVLAQTGSSSGGIGSGIGPGGGSGIGPGGDTGTGEKGFEHKQVILGVEIVEIECNLVNHTRTVTKGIRTICSGIGRIECENMFQVTSLDKKVLSSCPGSDCYIKD